MLDPNGCPEHRGSRCEADQAPPSTSLSGLRVWPASSTRRSCQGRQRQKPETDEAGEPPFCRTDRVKRPSRVISREVFSLPLAVCEQGRDQNGRGGLGEPLDGPKADPEQAPATVMVELNGIEPSRFPLRGRAGRPSRSLVRRALPPATLIASCRWSSVMNTATFGRRVFLSGRAERCSADERKGTPAADAASSVRASRRVIDRFTGDPTAGARTGLYSAPAGGRSGRASPAGRPHRIPASVSPRNKEES
jgi:hypothetical protein